MSEKPCSTLRVSAGSERRAGCESGADQTKSLENQACHARAEICPIGIGDTTPNAHWHSMIHSRTFANSQAQQMLNDGFTLTNDKVLLGEDPKLSSGWSFKDNPSIGDRMWTGDQQDILAQTTSQKESPFRKRQADDLASNETKSISPEDWINKDGNALAKVVAERTSYGGLMLLGPMDTMRPEAERYDDPNGYVPVFTHASAKDFHLYYTLHLWRKEYDTTTLATLIRENVLPGRTIRLLGCESGVNGGVARQLARLLPDYPIYAPDGYCKLKDGEAVVYKKKPSTAHGSEEPPRGEFVRIMP